MSATGWHIWSTREHGRLETPEAVERLPKGAEVSGDGLWAELADDKGVAKVYLRIALPGKPARRKKAA